LDWWYYSFETGQHISFYQRRTFEVIADKLGLSFVSYGGLHVLTDRHINRTSLRLWAGPLSGLGASVASRHLGSRVMSDHELMIERLRFLRRETIE
jgi:hypothetical protein